MKKYIPLLILLIVIVVITGIYFHFKNKPKFPPIEKFKNLDEPSKCIKTPYSKEYAQKILNSLKNDINKVHPMDEYQLSFHPLECCTLEDSATFDKKKVFICVKGKNGKYY